MLSKANKLIFLSRAIFSLTCSLVQEATKNLNPKAAEGIGGRPWEGDSGHLSSLMWVKRGPRVLRCAQRQKERKEKLKRVAKARE